MSSKLRTYLLSLCMLVLCCARNLFGQLDSAQIVFQKTFIYVFILLEKTKNLGARTLIFRSLNAKCLYIFLSTVSSVNGS